MYYGYTLIPLQRYVLRLHPDVTAALCSKTIPWYYCSAICYGYAKLLSPHILSFTLLYLFMKDVLSFSYVTVLKGPLCYPLCAFRFQTRDNVIWPKLASLKFGGRFLKRQRTSCPLYRMKFYGSWKIWSSNDISPAIEFRYVWTEAMKRLSISSCVSWFRWTFLKQHTLLKKLDFFLDLN